MLRTPFMIGAAVLSCAGLLATTDYADAKHKGRRHHHHGHHRGHIGVYLGSPYGYGSYGYRSGYWVESHPRIYVDTYHDPGYEVIVPSETVGAARPARIELVVPDANAEVWVQTTKTSSKGTRRVYETPPLERGKEYAYSVSASWTRDGKTVKEERKIPVKPGKISVVDFTRAPSGERLSPPADVPPPA